MSQATYAQTQQQAQVNPDANVVGQPQAQSNNLRVIMEQKNAMLKQAEELIKQANLIQDPTLAGPFKNNGHTDSASYANLIPGIREAIDAKRTKNINGMWFEKYRPEVFEEVLYPNQEMKETIGEFVKNKFIPGHCMFYGSGGVGKTTNNKVLMNSVLTHAADRFELDRKIESVDKLKTFLKQKSFGRQKIVIAEEFDRLSDAAQTELKNGLLESGSGDVVFLASTNKPHKIDPALLQRFTLKAKFDKIDPKDLRHKIKFILVNERIHHNDADIDTFITLVANLSIREILNALQLSCHQGIFDPQRSQAFIGNTGTEAEFINWITNFIAYLMQMDHGTLYQCQYNVDVDAGIKQYREYFSNVLVSNLQLNYDFIYDDLSKSPSLYLPVKNIVIDYYQDHELKKVKHLHFEAMLNDVMQCVYESRVQG